MSYRSVILLFYWKLLVRIDYMEKMSLLVSLENFLLDVWTYSFLFLHLVLSKTELPVAVSTNCLLVC